MIENLCRLDISVSYYLPSTSNEEVLKQSDYKEAKVGETGDIGKRPRIVEVADIHLVSIVILVGGTAVLESRDVETGHIRLPAGPAVPTDSCSSEIASGHNHHLSVRYGTCIPDIEIRVICIQLIPWTWSGMQVQSLQQIDSESPLSPQSWHCADLRRVS